MKTVFSKITALLFIFTSAISQCQEKNEKQKQMETLLETKEFIFIPETAIPQGFPTVNLSSSSNFLKIHADTIKGQLPYYGRSYTATPYGGNAGIEFNTTPSDYKLAKNKKYYEVTATVKGENDTYKLNLNVSFDGSATLHVIPNKRSSISYFGNISSSK